MAKALDLGIKEKARLNLLLQQFYLRDNEEIIYDYRLGADLKKVSYSPGDLLLQLSRQGKPVISLSADRMVMRGVSALIFNRILIIGVLTTILFSANLLSGI